MKRLMSEGRVYLFHFDSSFMVPRAAPYGRPYRASIPRGLLSEKPAQCYLSWRS